MHDSKYDQNVRPTKIFNIMLIEIQLHEIQT